MLGADSAGRYGCFLVMAIGVAMFAVALGLFFRGALTNPLRVALMLVGVAEVAVGYLALFRSRVGWSFALSINGTASVIFLFGAPKVRDAFSIDLGAALVPSFLLIVATTLVAAAHHEY